MPPTGLQTSRTDKVPPDTIEVWDLLVRVFHWTTVVGVVVAYFSEPWRDVHKAVGYFVMAVLAIRIAWGFIGSQHARFSDFVPTPMGLFRYLRSMLHFREQRYLGHNPAGGAMVISLMATLIVISVTGWMMTLDAYWGVDWVETLHAWSVNVLILIVPLHVAGVVWSSYRHRENLVKSMINGKKNP